MSGYVTVYPRGSKKDAKPVIIPEEDMGSVSEWSVGCYIGWPKVFPWCFCPAGYNIWYRNILSFSKCHFIPIFLLVKIFMHIIVQRICISSTPRFNRCQHFAIFALSLFVCVPKMSFKDASPQSKNQLNPMHCIGTCYNMDELQRHCAK